ncbi:MAG: hypothetical protein QNJ31_05730 [Candidatus Caenarcaniphilales bacterium]|nr:hypothetical protein [Candidatus Caenarcaniphilales bacterium]
MKWLIKTKSDVNIKDLVEKLNLIGCNCNDEGSVIPLDQKEQMLEVSGPRDLPDLLADEKGIIQICPSSEINYY